MPTDWFAAHKDGLRQIAERLVERRGFGILAGELYQNVRDSDATECLMTLELIPGKPQAHLVCEDNGEGFVDLTHAWTIFAPSAKKDDPTKAGRFNLGEKHVLSFCRTALIHTTSGSVQFSRDEGRQVFPRRKRDVGTKFEAEIDCTRERAQQFADYVKMLIVRPGLTVKFNGDVVGLMDQTGLEPRNPIRVFETVLKTGSSAKSVGEKWAYGGFVLARWIF